MAKKERVKWPPDLWYNLTHFKVYRKTFRRALYWEMKEAVIIGRTLFTILAVVVGVVLFWTMLGCLAAKNPFLAILAGVVVLGDAGFLIFLYRPNSGASFKECVVAADDEAYKAQLKHEREHPNIYR